MMPGDIYPYHVRGSRYSFNSGRVFYRYPNGSKIFIDEDHGTDLYNRLVETRQGPGGRFRVNEEGEIVLYRPIDQKQWAPYYVGKMNQELLFEGMDNNPRHLKPGMLWTGFLNNHGAKFHIEKSGRIFFRETNIGPTCRDRQDHYVQGTHLVLAKSLAMYKGSPGSFRINEHGHVWAPVPLEFAQREYGIDYLRNQDLTPKQKRTIMSYLRSTSEDGVTGGWLPIYIGHFPQSLRINRAPEPHMIHGTAYDKDEGIYLEWGDDE